VTVFVTGATGKLGPHVIASLVADGERVRALVRDPGKARALLPAEAELVHGDFAALPTIEAELAAANSMLLLTPHGPDMAAVQNTLINLAARAGTRVVKVSGTSAGIRPDGPDACRQHFDTEQHLAHSGVPWAVVRPNGFMQTLIVAMAATVRERGLIANPLGTAGISLVDCSDVGTATAAVLADPRYDGRHHVLTGPTAPTYAAIAALITEETGADVEVLDVTPEQAGDAARARGLSDWEAGHLTEMLAMFRTGASEYVTTDVEELTGRRPRSVRDFIRDHRDLFTR
jgi:NAD(P)H dehydrogenase (quinone)